MDPINNLSTALQTLRKRLDNSEITDKKTTKQKTSAHSQKLTTDELKRKITRKIKAADPDGKNSQVATQIFVENVLLWEFGEDLINDPKFEELTKNVMQLLTQDPELFDKLFKTLVG